MNRREMIAWIGGGLLSAVGLAAAIVFHRHYWSKRDCFNELGRCWDAASQTIYHEQSGVVWGGMAAAFILAGITLLWFGGSRR